MFRNTFSWKAALVIGGLALVALLVSPAAGAEQCALKDIKGVYVGTFSGVNVGGPFPGPFTALARISCDGKGKCSGAGWQSLNGLFLPFVNVETSPNITVNPDCTGSITVHVQGGPVLSYDVISTQDGKEAWSIQSDGGTVSSGHIQRIRLIPDPD